MVLLILGREEVVGRGEREKHLCERERDINHLPPACPLLGVGPAAWAYVLTRNQTGHTSVHGAMPSPLSHTGQGPAAVQNVLHSKLLRRPAPQLPPVLGQMAAAPSEEAIVLSRGRGWWGLGGDRTHGIRPLGSSAVTVSSVRGAC